jgi:microcystin-dependent protein
MITKFRLSLVPLAIVVSALLWGFVVSPILPARAQFSGQQTYGGTAGGTANAVTFTIQNWVVNNPGIPLQFVPASDNTGATTVNVTGVGITNVLRPSSIGLVAFSGHEFKAGVLTTIMYDGTQFELVGPLDMRPIGDTMEFRGSATPPGYLIEDGSCVSQTTYAALFSVISTTYGTCGGGLFAVPDSRGTLFAALDNQGANGAANRITSGGSSCAATSPILCGAQNQTLTIPQLPVVTPAGTVNSVVSGGTQGGISSTNTTTSGATTVPDGTTAIVVTSTFTGTPFGSGSAHPVLNPILLGRRAIKY